MFDAAGQTAAGVVKSLNAARVIVQVESIQLPLSAARFRVTVASAIPKGDRADWMIEKLAELGVDEFIPLAAERSVVLPGGRSKTERWERTAVEAAKQSRRSGVMRIKELTTLSDAIRATKSGWYLSTNADAPPALDAIAHHQANEITLFIGPEGGWSDREIVEMEAAGLKGIRLTSTILRVETAAVISAGLVLCRTGIHSPPRSG